MRPATARHVEGDATTARRCETVLLFRVSVRRQCHTLLLLLGGRFVALLRKKQGQPVKHEHPQAPSAQQSDDSKLMWTGTIQTCLTTCRSAKPLTTPVTMRKSITEFRLLCANLHSASRKGDGVPTMSFSFQYISLQTYQHKRNSSNCSKEFWCCTRGAVGCDVCPQQWCG